MPCRRGAYELLEQVRSTDWDLYIHSLRAGLMSGAVALAMGLSQHAAEHVAWAATLHDLGKLRPAILKIISKPGRLDEDERKIMQDHTIIGARTLEKTESIAPALRREAAAVALHHHETFNGKGYPFGLEGEQIPLAARIVNTADFLDALMENRPYRKGMSLEKAMRIMTEESDKFDPGVWNTVRGLAAAAVLPGYFYINVLAKAYQSNDQN